MANSFLGSALLGLANGVQQAQDDNQQRAYVKQAQTMQLQKMALMNRESDLTIQEKQANLTTQQIMAQSLAGVGTNPNDPTTGVQSVTGQPIFQAPQPPAPALSQMGNNGRLPQQNNAVQSAPSSPSAGEAGFSGINAQSKALYNSPDVQNDSISLLQNELSQKKTALASATDPNQKAQLEQDVAAVTKELAAKGGPRQLPPGIATAQANAIENKKEAGAPVSAPEFGNAADAQMSMAAKLDRAADNAARTPNGAQASVMLRAKADAIRKKAMDYAKENIDIRTKQNAEVKDVVGVIDPATMTQSDYNDMQSQLAQNPIFAERFKALGLTGNIDNDRNKLAQFSKQSETKAQADQHLVALSTLKVNELKAQNALADREQRRQDRLDKEKEDAEGKVPVGYRRTADGKGVEAIPGGPADPNSPGKVSGFSQASLTRMGQQIIEIGEDMTQSINTLKATPFTTGSVFGGRHEDGIFSAGIKEFAGRKMTDDENRQMDIVMSGFKRTVGQAMGAAGMRGATEGLMKELDALNIKPGDKVEDAQLIVAEGVGIVRNAVNAVDTSKLSKEQQQKLNDLKSSFNGIPTPAEVQQKKYGTGPNVGGAVPKSGASAPTKISGDADYDALPSGAHFTGPDGKLRVKP